jgi:hypothetical protein
LYSRNFLPLAGVQLAALESKEDEELGGNETIGSCQAKELKQDKVSNIKNDALKLFTNINSCTNTVNSS